MSFFKWLLESCYCMILPEDEYERENTDDTIVPTGFIPINEYKHNNPFDTDSQFSQFTATHRFILYH